MIPTPVNAIGSNDKFARYRLWKDQNVPLVYDWLSSRTLSWPHGAVQWGALTTSHVEEQRRIERNSQTFSNRSLFLAERTDNTNNPRDPNTLLQYEVRIVHELVNKPADIAKPWIEDGSASDRDSPSSRDFALRKRILHPGEVNRIRLIAANVVITHTDSPKLLVWDMERQPEPKKNNTEANIPTCVLTGHTQNAEFAVDVSPNGAMSQSARNACIVSGGSDLNVCFWRLRDYEAFYGALEATVIMRGVSGKPSEPSGASRLSGHTDVVEDVSFRYDNPDFVVSVGRDSSMILWDVRTPTQPADKIHKAHQGDVNCCDFGGLDDNQVITGGNDRVVRVWDIRKIRDANNNAQPLGTLYGHRRQITNLSWNRFERNVFASGADDGEVLVWRMGEHAQRHKHMIRQDEGAHSPELMFRHVGHNQTESKITDLDWLPSSTDRWCMASLSESLNGGSTLQMWRMTDLIYRKKEDVMEELRQHYDRVS